MASEQKQGAGSPASGDEDLTNFAESRIKPDKEFAGTVDMAIGLNRRIKADLLMLERLKVEIREGARGRLPEGKRRDPAGCEVSLNGKAGIATVTFSADRGIAAFWFASEEPDAMALRYKDNKVTPLGEMRRIAGKCFGLLFRPQYKPTRDFAQVVARLREKRKLTKAKAAELLSLCLEPSTPKVELEDLS